MKRRLSIVIVTYRSAPELGPCLRALREAGAFTSSHAAHAQVIVVDNASNDDTLEVARAEAPEALLLAGSENVGFGRACNAGARAARGEALLFLNPDTLVLPGSLEAMLAALDASPGIGAVGPRLLDTSGASVDDHRPLPTPKGELQRLTRRFGAEASSPAPLTSSPEWLCGACLMIRRDTWEHVGSFDEGFFLYYEETDWCRRALDRGWTFAHVEAARVVHQGGASAKRAGQPMQGNELARHMAASRRRYFRKHHGWAPAALVAALHAGRRTVDSWKALLR